MAEDLVDYASPGLRWGLITEDYRSIRAEFGIATAEELGLPKQVAEPEDEFVFARIIFPPESGREEVLGYKPWTMQVRGRDNKMRTVNVEHPSDHFQTLCTKALGRALKRAGYPDDLVDLKALMFWRQRLVELENLGNGTTVQLDGGSVAKALEAAGRPDPEATGGDDGVEEAEVVQTSPAPASAPAPAAVEVEPDPDDAPSAETLRAMRDAIGALDPEVRKQVTAWCQERGWKVSKPATEKQAQDICLEALRLRDVDPATGEVGGAGDGPAAEPGSLGEEVAKLVSGLTPEEQRGFAAYCQTIGVDAAFTDWATADDEILDSVAAWLEIR